MEQKQPDIEKEDFVQGFRFVHIPRRYVGESFTKGYLETFLLMQDQETNILRLYKAKHTVPLTGAFLKYAWRGLEVYGTGTKLKILDPEELSDLMLNWDDPSKKVEMMLYKEFQSDFETYSTEILKLQEEARDRGWCVIISE